MKKLWNRYSYAIILLVLCGTFALSLSFHNQTNDQDKFLTVTISEGDSLWKISEQFSEQHSLTNNQFVSWVKKHNDIDENQIYPGEEIIIPVSKEAPPINELASAADE